MFFSPPPPTHHPHSIPSSHRKGSLRGHLGFSLNPWQVDRTHPSSTRIQILIRKIKSKRWSRWTDRQTGRETARWREAMTNPHPLIYVSPHPHQPAGGRTGMRRRWKGGMNREKKNWKDRVGLHKTNPRPACDWHLVTVTSSYRLCHTQQTHKHTDESALAKAYASLSSLHRVTFHQCSI